MRYTARRGMLSKHRKLGLQLGCSKLGGLCMRVTGINK